MTWGVSLKDSHHSGPSDPGLNLDAGVSQLAGDQSRGILLVEGKFRVGVNLPPDSDEVIFELRCLIQKTDRELEPAAQSF